MRSLILRAVVMASRKDRSGGSGAAPIDFSGAGAQTTPPEGGETTGQTNTQANGAAESEDSKTRTTVLVEVGPDAAEKPAPTLDRETGVLTGEGYEETDEGVATEPIAMPKQIVAKEIIPRDDLVCKRKFIQEKDAKGDPLFGKDGAPIGDWEVTPPTPLYTVFGTAKGAETGESGFGPWIRYIGDFEAVRTKDGKRYQSDRLILQEPAESLLLAALRQIKAKDPAGSVQFAFNVGKKTSTKWVSTGMGSSYEYTVESVISIKKHDPLAVMRRALTTAGALPAPVAKQLAAPSTPNAAPVTLALEGASTGGATS